MVGLRVCRFTKWVNFETFGELENFCKDERNFGNVPKRFENVQRIGELSKMFQEILKMFHKTLKMFVRTRFQLETSTLKSEIKDFEFHSLSKILGKTI